MNANAVGHLWQKSWCVANPRQFHGEKFCIDEHWVCGDSDQWWLPALTVFAGGHNESRLPLLRKSINFNVQFLGLNGPTCCCWRRGIHSKFDRLGFSIACNPFHASSLAREVTWIVPRMDESHCAQVMRGCHDHYWHLHPKSLTKIRLAPRLTRTRIFTWKDRLRTRGQWMKQAKRKQNNQSCSRCKKSQR